jgi:hypothetical protein
VSAASRKLTGRQVRDLLAGQPAVPADPDASRLAAVDARRLGAAAFQRPEQFQRLVVAGRLGPRAPRG